MKLKIAREEVWAAGMQDKPGQLAQKLDSLAQAGVNLGFIIARRAPEKPGTGVVFVTPIRGPRQTKAAQQAGFKKTNTLHSVCVAAADRPGLGARLTGHLAQAGINLRGFSGASIGKNAVFHMAFTTAAAAGKAIRCLKKF